MPKQHLTAIVGADTRKFNRAMGKVGKSVKRIGVALGAVGSAAAAGLARATVAAINYGDSIDKAAKRTGISAESLQRLALAAELSGTNVEALEKGMKRMSSVVLDAQNGLMESVRALDDLGLSADQMAKKTPEDQLNTFLEALAGIESHSKRAALAQDVFGRAGTSLLPIIDQGAAGYRELIGEADKLNAVLSQDQVTAAANAKDAMTRLQTSLKALGFGAILREGESMATMLNGLAERVAEFSASGGMRDFNDTMRSTAEVMSVIATVIGFIVEKLGAFGKGIENIIGAAGFTQTGLNMNQLESGTGQFGAASTSDEVLFRLRMISENTWPLKSQSEGI